jgi:hypothetical protein
MVKYSFVLATKGTSLTVDIDDVLRARLKTVGVSEYRCEMEAVAGRESGTEWRIVDVGGSRSQVRISCFSRPTLNLFQHVLSLQRGEKLTRVQC